MFSRILGYFLMVSFSQNLIAKEVTDSISCYDTTNKQIETCQSISLVTESSCTIKITDTTNQEALDLINKHLKGAPSESAIGVLIVQGSKNTDLVEKLKNAAELCQKEISKYQSQCDSVKANISTCEDSENSLSDDSISLNKSSFNISENKFSIAQENYLELSNKIERLEVEIKKTARDLCKQGFETVAKSRDCENPSAELSKKISDAFASCAKENTSYNRSECFNTVKPSLKGDYTQPASQAPSYAKMETPVAPASIPEKPSTSESAIAPTTISNEKVERKLASDTLTSTALPASPKVKKNNVEASDYNEVALLKKSPNEDSNTSSRSSSEFKWPSLGTILKVAAGALLVYGAVTGKLKKWFNKFAEAINPYSASNTRSPSSSSGNNAAGGSSGCYGTFRGTIDMPPHEERIIARNIKIRSIGKQVTGNPAIDNAATGGGAPDGGMFLTGSFEWETDANCRVVSGTAYIFGHPFSITGAINKDRSFNLSYLGPMPGYITSNNLVKGKLQHGGGEEYIYGYLNGHFTPRK